MSSIVLALVVGVPLSALAYGDKSIFGSLLSFSRTFFVAPVVASSGDKRTYYGNSQTISLLKSAISPDQAVGGGDITVSNNALVATVGPNGSLADIDPISTTHNGGKISHYIVRTGDTLSQIAELFDVSVNTIAWANDLGDGRVIHEGQELVILPINGIQYTVGKGDTLSTIAKAHNGDVQEIATYNNLDVDAVLKIGTTITIPDGELGTHTETHTSTRSVVASTASAPSYNDYFINPVPSGSVRTQGVHGYNGIDLAAPVGTPIVAAADGEVIIARGSSGSCGWNGGYGCYVVIKHGNGTQTLYAHNSSNAVSRGEYVVQGQVVGHIGSTGRSTGPHLHVEVRGAKNPF